MFAYARTSALVAVVAFGQECPGKPCEDDSVCEAPCNWCSATGGKDNNQTCSGPPSPDDCGVLPEPPTTSKPQFAVWGDSVSKGYYRRFSKSLTDFEVFHPSIDKGGGCGNVVRGSFCTDLWLNGADATSPRQWDVITFNFGLHDVAEDDEHDTLKVYKRNLRNISVRLQAQSKKLVFVTTTPVPNTTKGPHYPPADVVTYNEAAKQIMQDLNITVIDLHAFVLEKCGGNVNYTSCAGFQKENNVHFTGQSYNVIADYLYDAITTSPVMVV